MNRNYVRRIRRQMARVLGAMAPGEKAYAITNTINTPVTKTKDGHYKFNKKTYTLEEALVTLRPD